MDTLVENRTIDTDNLTVGQLAISEPGAVKIFMKYDIDYCCGGHRSVEDACRRAGADPEKVKAELCELTSLETELGVRPDTWTSAFLIDFIVENHHGFVRRATPALMALLDKVCEVHGKECLELQYVRESFLALSRDLVIHMEKEEAVLFPAIKRLESSTVEDYTLSLIVQTPINAMEHDHKIAGDLMKQIRLLSKHYSPPDFACPTFRIAFRRLREFDHDLMRHIHLENNILFDRLKPVPALGGSCSL